MARSPCPDGEVDRLFKISVWRERAPAQFDFPENPSINPGHQIASASKASRNDF